MSRSPRTGVAHHAPSCCQARTNLSHGKTRKDWEFASLQLVAQWAAPTRKSPARRPRPAAAGTLIPGPGRIGKRGVSRFPIPAESGIGDSLPVSQPDRNRGDGNWGFPGLGSSPHGNPPQLAVAAWSGLGPKADALGLGRGGRIDGSVRSDLYTVGHGTDSRTEPRTSMDRAVYQTQRCPRSTQCLCA